MAPKRRGGGASALPSCAAPWAPCSGPPSTGRRRPRRARARAPARAASRLDDACAPIAGASDALAELGEIVLDLIRRGEIDLDELPEARELIAHLDELDAETDAGPEHRARPGRAAGSTSAGPPRVGTDTDGTVSSGARWAPPRRPSAERVWRPPTDDAPAAQAAPASRIPTLPKDPHRKGGISFDDDDLADYMHPDDVPPKDPTDGDS